MRQTLLLVCLMTLAGCHVSSCNVQVRHLQLNDAHLIDTGANSFAITSPELRQSNWQTISVNGDNVIIYGPNCEQNIRTTQSLTDAEKNAIQNAKQLLQSSESSGTMTNSAFGAAKYTLSGNGVASMSNSNSMHMSSFSNNHLSISKSDDNNFVISKAGLPNNIAMIMSMGTNIGFIYNDGQVQMKPVTCLQPAEQQLLQQVKVEIQQADQQFKTNMNEFQNNMHNMQQQLQQNMRNMQQQMQQNMGNMQQQMQSNFGNMFGGYSNPAANSAYGANQNLNYPYANQNFGPYANQPLYHSPPATGLLGNIFSGITRQFQRPFQSPVMQQSSGLWPFG